MINRALALGLVLLELTVGVPTAPTMAAETPRVAIASPRTSLVTDGTTYSAVIDNPWFPLRRRQRLIYKGRDARGPISVTMVVSQNSTVVAGIPCTAVVVTITRSGTTTGRVTEWYTEDATGTVWAMGVSGDAGWRAGVDGARPQPVVPVDPRSSDLQVRVASAGFPASSTSDATRIIATRTDVDVSVPFGSFTGAVQTIAWAPFMERPTFTTFAALIGVVRQTSGSTDLRLVAIRTPRPRRGG